MIPYGRQDITEADLDAVAAVLRSDFLTQGPRVPAFEDAVAGHVGAAHGVAMNSATSALHVACLALGLGPGDRLWTQPISFVASANCALYCGASVDFVDIEPDTFAMSVDALAAKLERAEAAGTLPKVVVPVAMGGLPPDLAGIRRLADRYGFKVVHDASHAIGARWDGAFVGAPGQADITVFSFHPVKIVTTAEGGMAVTQDAALARRMAMLRSHGITRDPAAMTEASHGPWYYQQVALGLNYRMTEMQAALGVSQMMRLDDYVAARMARADAYDAALAGLPLALPGRRAGASSSWHLYVVRLDDPSRHRAVFEGLQADGIGVNLHYIPIHTQPYYAAMGFAPDAFPASMDYYARAISIPLFAQMTDDQQEAVTRALRRQLA
ncbi:UDP-4-amino-4,6-dideoxy-N-acetyl-beta-L-altrosamine transaminase [Jannaschia sp. LMIT008]|uniref:UDP-4-amino-4, 6-dideoxy-N-acetyl-beta-L-altrosamine transaminase n=1 Tax=Jannaschia maritima TaxID=3032585 RepID=UPI00281278BB|nr:UDP-4-amino-4,6-dideoxy-N-acetyl-beta-L-altrosamine transaminase [Jannaschia sp. LMIT008]